MKDLYFVVVLILSILYGFFLAFVFYNAGYENAQSGDYTDVAIPEDSYLYCSEYKKAHYPVIDGDTKEPLYIGHDKVCTKAYFTLKSNYSTPEKIENYYDEHGNGSSPPGEIVEQYNWKINWQEVEEMWNHERRHYWGEEHE